MKNGTVKNGDKVKLCVINNLKIRLKSDIILVENKIISIINLGGTDG
ncbi:hypothetical protein [Leptotrichia sp. oral taxon 847]|nr:hypothetical protein [Leptotrichia sp. oral taxon 847]